MGGLSLALMGWMRRQGRLELIVVLPDGSRLMLPAAWTDLEAPVGPPQSDGTLGSLQDLLAMRRVLEPLCERVVLAEGDDRGSGRTNGAAASGSGGVTGAGGGAVGAGRRGGAAGGDGAFGGADRQTLQGDLEAPVAGE